MRDYDDLYDDNDDGIMMPEERVASQRREIYPPCSSLKRNFNYHAKGNMGYIPNYANGSLF